MKKSIAGILSAATMLATLMVWYSCTKDSEVTTGGIYGTVTDYATGEPVGNANVKLKPTGETTLTGSDGTYEFKDLDPNKYSLHLSKAEYADLDDDYVITVETGKKAKRDVQMRKQTASLKITDMAGNDITELDFGITESITSKSFNIFNNGTLNITCEVNYECVWISSVSNITNPITPGQTVTVTVTIDRSRLSGGENSTFLHIVSNNGSNELKVTATGIDLPTVTTSNVSSITASSATCGGNVTADGGSYVTERGVCWATTNAPTVQNSHVAMGQGNGSFTCNMTNLEPNNVYYVRAYATNNRGTAYGEQKQFTTNSGLPTVTINTVSNITATSATCGGSITDNGGFAVTDKGLVWSTSQYPTLNDNHISLGTGNAPFIGSMTNLSDGITYYVRTYATNSQGTAYSEQLSFSINLDYLALPTFQHGGHTYRVAPHPDNLMTWSDANAYCNNLTLYEQTGWRMPTKEELLQMYNDRSSIGSFDTIAGSYSIYWCSTPYGSQSYYYVSFYDGSVYHDYNHYTVTSRVRPIRLEN